VAVATNEHIPQGLSPLPSPERRDWWYQQERISHHLAGVFEGGGAKGMAYVGALEALEQGGFWFNRVAGSSAGALTAALIASGATPDEIRIGMNHMLDTVRGGRLAKTRRMLRLYWHGGMFPKHPLHVWIENWLLHQVRGVPLDESTTRGFDPRYTDNPVTFSELFLATGIECNVIAANLSIQRQMVFSHHETPDCQVSDAVIASCSLPLAFHNADLVATDEGDQRQYLYTVVDGGVWSNFPIWLFTDKAFERWAHRKEMPEAAAVVGFVLREPRPDEKLEDARFHRYGTRRNWLGRVPCNAYEWRKSKNSTFWLSFGVFLAPTRLLDAAGLRTLSRARWPDPEGPIKSFIGGIVESWLRVMSAVVFGLVLLVVAVYTGYFIYQWLGERIASGRDTLLGITIIALDAIYVLGGITITLVVLFVANFFLGTALRRIGYGLMRTFAAAPGAPAWVEERDDVIIIELPEGATTLNFDFDPDVLIERGRAAVASNLGELRNRLNQPE
jgi:predicted acylesterase/phospholipase RssA